MYHMDVIDIGNYCQLKDYTDNLIKSLYILGGSKVMILCNKPVLQHCVYLCLVEKDYMYINVFLDLADNL